MIYVGENGAVIESIDLSKGYLVDEEWIDHPAVQQEGHYEYAGRVQTYVVDTPAAGAWREVTKQRFIPYTQEELTAIERKKYDARLESLESQLAAYETAYTQGVNEA